MQHLEQDWITEVCESSSTAFSFRCSDRVWSEKTPYQQLDIYKTPFYGTVMLLDGCIQLTSRDNFIYHEMMTHPALFAHPDPKRVAIIGGGDCGSLREVLRHTTVTDVWQIDIDRRVTELSQQFFPELCVANADPRAHLHFDDGVQWLCDRSPASLDVLIIDSTDPIGPGKQLYTTDFHRACQRVLGDQGILVQQSESPLYHQSLITGLRTTLQQADFSSTHITCFPLPSYPSGWWSCLFATGSDRLQSIDAHRHQQQDFKTRYYNASIHRSAFSEPPQFMSGWCSA